MADGWDVESDSVEEPATCGPSTGSGAASSGQLAPNIEVRDRSRSRSRSLSRSTESSPDRSDRRRVLVRSATADPPPVVSGCEYWQHPMWHATAHWRAKMPVLHRAMTWELFCAGAGGETQVAKA